MRLFLSGEILIYHHYSFYSERYIQFHWITPVLNQSVMYSDYNESLHVESYVKYYGVSFFLAVTANPSYSGAKRVFPYTKLAMLAMLAIKV